MMRTLLIILFFLPFLIQGQKILHPKGKGHKSITVEAGKTYKYYDDGGPNENYTYLTNSMLTIYPSKKGQYVSIKFNKYDVNSDCRLYIFDGDHGGADILGYYDIHAESSTYRLRIGDVITASSENKSGALSIRFANSRKRESKSGWEFTVSCSKTAGTPVRKTSQDCSGAIKVCSNSAITTKASGAGVQELPGPYFWNTLLNYGKDGENQSNWYKFEVASSGTIKFVIRPHSQTDFDWALWGPYEAHECPAWTNDKFVRASACDGRNSQVTGLSSFASDFSEDSWGDGFVAPIHVSKGQHYVLMIDDWSGNSTTFDLGWKFENGASLECKKDKEPPPKDPPLPIEITEEEIDSVETVEEVDLCAEGMKFKSTIQAVTKDQLGRVSIEVEGGTIPYSYRWKDKNGKEISTKRVLSDVGSGEYVLTVIDKNDCEHTEKFEVSIEVEEEEDEVNEPKLTAELSKDTAFVTVGYPGPFEYKIEDMEGITVITGHSVDTDLVEITKLPPGKYRVSLIYKQIKQYVIFEKK